MNDETAKNLVEAGFNTIQKVAEAAQEDLIALKGLGKKSAEKVQAAAEEMVGTESKGKESIEALSSIEGVSEELAAKLLEADYNNVEEVAFCDVEEMAALMDIKVDVAIAIQDAAVKMEKDS